MTAPARFRQADVSRAVKAAQGAGLRIGRVDIAPDGRISIIAAGEERAPDAPSSLDRLLGDNDDDEEA